MRGGAFLSGLRDAIVVDIGGTTTDVGVLKDGFPREASSQLKVTYAHAHTHQHRYMPHIRNAHTHTHDCVSLSLR